MPVFTSKPVRWVVGFAAGASNDVVARTVSARLAESMGQQFIIDNRGGGSGTIGTAIVAKATPDGYTILMTGTPFAVSPAIYRKLPYHPVKDFAPVSFMISFTSVLVVEPRVPAKSVAELMAWTKANPDKAIAAMINWNASMEEDKEKIQARKVLDVTQESVCTAILAPAKELNGIETAQRVRVQPTNDALCRLDDVLRIARCVSLDLGNAVADPLRDRICLREQAVAVLLFLVH